MTEGRQIFRQQSLEKLQSPDRLDQMLRIVRPQSWIIVSAVAVGFGLLLAWGIFGHVTASAEGAAVLVKPKKVVLFQSPVAGQVDRILVEVDEAVEKGQLPRRAEAAGGAATARPPARSTGVGEAPPRRSVGDGDALGGAREAVHRRAAGAHRQPHRARRRRSTRLPAEGRGLPGAARGQHRRGQGTWPTSSGLRSKSGISACRSSRAAATSRTAS